MSSSYFTNPFAPTAQGPVFASSPLSPLPTNSYPIPSNLRRSSLVRASPSPGHHPIDVPVSPGSVNGNGSIQAGGVTFTSPFAPGKSLSPPGSAQPPASRRGSLQTTGSRPPSRGSSQTRIHGEAGSGGLSVPAAPPSRRGSLQNASPLRSPNAGPHSPFFSHLAPPPPGPSSPTTTAPSTTANFLKQNPHVDFSRRRSVDVGVLGLGTHRQNGVGSMSKRVRDAVGPDAGDKESGFVASNLKGGKDRMLGRHLASILAHSLALCADPPIDDTPPHHEDSILLTPSLDAIPASPSSSPSTSRNTSITDSILSCPSISGTSPPPEKEPMTAPAHAPVSPPTFPVLSEAKRVKMINSLQSWSFNAMSYNSDELLSCVGIMFESVRNMEGVEFDFERLRSLLLSLRSAYHARNGYHNFSHATDVTQACYSFLVRMGLAPPLYLLCEDDYDSNIGHARRKWRRNRAVEEGGMGELLRPMDVFALMIAAIGHDVGHPGLSNAYMVNARTPVAQVYDDKSVLENFHTVTLIHMLRRHNFDYLLGGDFGHLGPHATSFRKVVEASILATDMSRHFGFVTQLNDLGRRFGERRGLSSNTIEDDRLLLCSGLIKCADISNPTRPHRISRLWSTALLDEWAVQATIETEFGLPVSVMTIDPADTRAQAKSQVGFIDLFAKPLFNAMAVVVDEFADFAAKLRDGRIAWEAISLQTDDAFRPPPVPADWKLNLPPPRSGASSPLPSPTEQPRPASVGATAPLRPAPAPRGRSNAFRPHVGHDRHGRNTSDASSSANSPLSPAFSNITGASSASDSEQPSLFSRSPRTGGFHHPDLKTSCGGACQTATATCETCSRRQDPSARRASLGRAGAGLLLSGDDDDMDDEVEDDSPDWLPRWPFLPGVFSPTPPTS